MPAGSQFQHVFRINKPEGTANDQQNSSKPRRNRQPLSCDACRARKLKCDRQSPCAPCFKRGDAASSSCTYAKIAKDGGRPPTSPNSTRSEAQHRLQKLEEMVTDLIQASSSHGTIAVPSDNVTADQLMKEVSVSPQSSSETSGSMSIGHLYTNGEERHYRGATHWSTMLENIQDIRELLDSTAESTDDDQSSGSPGVPDVLLGTGQSMKLDDFLDALPPKAAVDNLVSTYLTSDGLRAPHVHPRKFLREYRAFWADPSSTSLLWVSMLFSILWTTRFFGPLDSASSSNHIAFFTKSGQALVAGGYHKARPYSADAALLYALCSFYMSKHDGDTDCWLTMGLATRLSVKMGYHRDPKHLVDISPFEGEMRRRCFFLIDSFDVLLSNQFGLPTILQEEDCDTETPRNLYDDDFDEDCKSLPPSRPSTDSTPMLYFCYKSRFAKSHKRAIRHALTLETTCYDETLKLDAELHANDADVPRSLQLTSLDELLLDQTWQILRRMHIKFQYLRSLCVLHRKYLNQGRTDPKFAYSRMTCTDAALQLLKHQSDLFLASQPGGRLSNDKSMITMCVQHHFLLAAMIICLDLHESHNQQTLSTPQEIQDQAAEHDALRASHEVWLSRQSFSRDAQRASTIIAKILSKVPRPNTSNSPVRDASWRTTGNSQPVSNGGSLHAPSAPLTVPVPSMNDTRTWLQQPPSGDFPVLPLDATDPVNLIFDGTENIDWDILDQYLIEGNGVSEESTAWQMQPLPGPGMPP